jgi:hypothetical protein
MTGSKQEPILPKHKHEAYVHRDVASLPAAFTQWTESFAAIQREHNRILQPGFMHRDVDAVLADAKKAGVAWLTDICCPSAKADIMLHISKEMVVNYQVADTELNIKAHEVYASLVEDREEGILASINTEVERQIQLIPGAKIQADAEALLLANFKAQGLKKEDITVEQLQAATNIVLDKERRKIMDTIVPNMVSAHLKVYGDSLGLASKTRHKIGETHDFFYGGPAGSGKSTISKIDLSEKGTDLSKVNKMDCVTVATDIYRAFTLPGTEDHEKIETKDIFTRTQDFAYMVKELVLNELKEMSNKYSLELMSSLPGGDIAQAKEGKVYLSEEPREYYVKGMRAPEPIPPGIDLTNLATKLNNFSFKSDILWMTSNAGHTQSGERPNLINDGVTVEWDVRTMLSKSERLVSKVALYRGDEAGYRGIAERAYDRATKTEDVDPADKGRYVETTSLFKGHADASRFFLGNLPGNAVTEIYDTNINRDLDEKPVKVAVVDTANHQVEILNLRVMSEWLNKKNLNVEAEHPVELILNKQSAQRITDPENKAKAVLDLVQGNPYARPPVPYSVILKNADGDAYASLVSDGKGKVKLEVTDFAKFKELVNRESSPEAQVLRAITRQTKEATAALSGSLEAQAAELVEGVEKHIVSSHQSAIEERVSEARYAARKRYIEENPDVAFLLRLEDELAFEEYLLDVGEVDGPGLDSLEAIFEQNVEFELEVRQTMMEVARIEEMERAVVITPQVIEEVRGLYLEAPEGLKVQLDDIFRRNVEQQQLGDLGSTYREVRKLFLEYHSDHSQDKETVKDGYHQLNAVRERLDKLIKLQAQERQTGVSAIEHDTQETMSITTGAQQSIPRSLDLEGRDEVDEIEGLDDVDKGHDVAVEVVAARVISAAVASPKIITGNYSAIMACFNDILTNTVAIAPDGDKPGSSPIHLIAEPMWLDAVHPSYDNELWGQSIDAFPPAVQKFAKERLDPSPNDGEKLTWGQVRALRHEMLEHIKQNDGFIVHEGEIEQVEEVPRLEAEDENEKELQIKLVGQEQPVTIPFTGQPVVLDMSQRPRAAGPAFRGDPTVLYRNSRQENTTTLSDVPIIISGSGAQAAWVLDKMGSDRSYHISYRNSLDFRIANAILGRDHYTASTALPSVTENPLKDALAPLANGAPKAVTYTKDDGTKVDLVISVYPGDNVKVLDARDMLQDDLVAIAALKKVGVKPDEAEQALRDIREELGRRGDQHLEAGQLAVKLCTNMEPLSFAIGFGANVTGWVSLKETVNPQKDPPYWGPSAQVSTGDELVRAAKLVTTASLLPGSGLPRALAIKEEIRAMRASGEGAKYDVRALAFTGAGFDKMCDECKFPPEFKADLAKAIKQLGSPSNATPNPVAWIVSQYEEWLVNNPQLSKEDELSFAAVAKEALENNVKQNMKAEGIPEAPKEKTYVLSEQAKNLFTFFGSGASGPIESRALKAVRILDLTNLAKQGDQVDCTVEKRQEIIQILQQKLSQEELMGIKHESPTAQEAWDQQYALVPRN